MTRMQRYLLFLTGLALAGQPSAGKIRDDWAQVMSLDPGRKIAVALHQASRVDSLPRGKSKVKGVLSSASGASITLQWKNGQSVTIDRDAVRKVSVRIPVDRRTKGWIGTAAVFGAVQVFASLMDRFDDDVPVEGYIQSHGFITIPSAFLFLRGFGMKEIYNVPPWQESKPN